MEAAEAVGGRSAVGTRAEEEEEEVKALMADIMAANVLITQAAKRIFDIEAASKLIAKAKLGTAGEVVYASATLAAHEHFLLGGAGSSRRLSSGIPDAN